MLRATCYVLRAACYVLRAVCYMLRATSYMLRAACYVLHDIYAISIYICVPLLGLIHNGHIAHTHFELSHSCWFRCHSQAGSVATHTLLPLPLTCCFRCHSHSGSLATHTLVPLPLGWMTDGNSKSGKSATREGGAETTAAGPRLGSAAVAEGGPWLQLSIT